MVQQVNVLPVTEWQKIPISEVTFDRTTTVGSSSTLVMAANRYRSYAVFVNDSNEVIYLAIGGRAASMNSGIRLNASGGAYEINKHNLRKGAVYAICSSGSKVLCAEESETQYVAL